MTFSMNMVRQMTFSGTTFGRMTKKNAIFLNDILQNDRQQNNIHHTKVFNRTTFSRSALSRKARKHPRSEIKKNIKLY